MKNKLLIAFLKARLHWNRVVASSIADETRMNHNELRWVNPKYRTAYSNYTKIKERLIELGAFKQVSRR